MLSAPLCESEHQAAIFKLPVTVWEIRQYLIGNVGGVSSEKTFSPHVRLTHKILRLSN